MIRETKFNEMLLNKFGDATTISDIDFILDHNGKRYALEVKEIDDNKDRWDIEESQLIILKWLEQIIPVYYIFYNPTLTDFYLIRPSHISNMFSSKDVKNGKTVSVISVLKGETYHLSRGKLFDVLTSMLKRG